MKEKAHVFSRENDERETSEAVSPALLISPASSSLKDALEKSAETVFSPRKPNKETRHIVGGKKDTMAQLVIQEKKYLVNGREVLPGMAIRRYDLVAGKWYVGTVGIVSSDCFDGK